MLGLGQCENVRLLKTLKQVAWAHSRDLKSHLWFCEQFFVHF